MITRGCRERQECLFVYRLVANRIEYRRYVDFCYRNRDCLGICQDSIGNYDVKGIRTDLSFGRCPGEGSCRVMLAPTGAPLKEKVSVWTGTS